MKSRIIETNTNKEPNSTAEYNVPPVLDRLSEQAAERVDSDSKLLIDYYSKHYDSDDDSEVSILTQAMLAERAGLIFIDDESKFNQYLEGFNATTKDPDLPVLSRAILKSRVQNMVDKYNIHQKRMDFEQSVKSLNRIVSKEEWNILLEKDKQSRKGMPQDNYTTHLANEIIESDSIKRKYGLKDSNVYARYSEVAPGVFADINIVDRCPNRIFDKNGREASIVNWQKDNDFGLTYVDTKLLRMSHNTLSRQIFTSELGVDITKIPINSQMRFLNYAIEANDSQYGHLKNQLQEYNDDSEKVELINSFLSLRFGDHFGDKLLHIAEKLPKDEALRVFRNINEIRASSDKISEYFDGSVDGLKDAMKIAWVKRTTELLAIIDSDGSNWEEVYQAIGLLDILNDASKQITVMLGGDLEKKKMSDKDSLGVYGNEVRSSYKCVDDSVNKSTISITGFASNYQPDRRIGFTVVVPDKLIPPRYNDGKNRLSIRLDYDQYGLSLDIGTKQGGYNEEGYAHGSLVSNYVCDLLEKGEKLVRHDGEEVNGHHVREAFADVVKKVTPDVFEFQIINGFLSKLKITNSNLLFFTANPKSGEDTYEK